MSRRHVLGGYTAWMALLIAAYYGLPGLRVATWGLIGLSGTAAIVVGVVLNRPSRKTPWLLLAAGQASFVAGQVQLPDRPAHRRRSSPSPPSPTCCTC